MNRHSWLLVSSRWPELCSTASALHTNGFINIIKSIISLNNLYFISPHSLNEYTDLLTEKGIQCYQCLPNRDDFDKIIDKVKPNVVIFDRFIMEEQFNWKLSSNIFKILDTQDLHFLRKVRMEYTKKYNEIAPIYPSIDYENDTSFLRELASIHRSDLVLVVSSFEKDYLISHFSINENKILVAPFWYEDIDKNISSTFEERNHFMMLGNFLHPPNINALEWCNNNLWKKIKNKIPQAELHVYGAYPTKHAKNLSNPKKGLYVYGPVVDLQSLFNKYRINFAPLRFGAGIKGKITDGWYYNTPCITTRIGAEGLNPNNIFGGYICNTEDEIVEKSEQLYNNKIDWNKQKDIGQNIIKNNFSMEITGKEFKNNLINKINNMNILRKSNYFGSILNYSTHRYTKYFSKYIG